ncbi:hypothetical protein H4R34_004860 [Dimargaris verticillata]|uniref:Uncharacterized protein n=1 Tax=Dimargaris verticillata TaxID=2761393 RepID=A0A9W8B3G2_9FUNG|nr:hypothetical protein H4R34_004860 [Dimargaris verticillata]
MKVLMTFAILQATLPAWLALANTEATTHQLAHLDRRNSGGPGIVDYTQDGQPIYEQGTKQKDIEEADPDGGSASDALVANDHGGQTSASEGVIEGIGRSIKKKLFSRRQVKVPGEYDSLERRAPTFANQVAMHKRQVERDAVLH